MASSDAHVQAVRDDAVGRISERLGDPFVFAFALTFVIREWQFLYVIAAGVGEPMVAIARANNLFHWQRVVIDVAIAAAYILVWPHINRRVVGYLADQSVATENRRARAASGRLMPLSTILTHPRFEEANNYVEALTQVVASNGQALSSAVPDAGEKGFGVAVCRHAGVNVPGFAWKVGEEPLQQIVPAGTVYGGNGHQVVYLVRVFASTFDMGLLLFVAGECEVDWPAGVPSAPFLWWHEGGWEPSEQLKRPGLQALHNARARLSF